MTHQNYTIKECLHGYTNDALGAMCDAWSLTAGNKPGRIRALEKVLHEPPQIRVAIEMLDDSALRLAALVAGRGQAEASDLLSVPGLFCRNKPEAVLQQLVQLGILMACPQERAGAFSFALICRKYQPGEASPILFVPDHVGRLLPAAPPLATVVPVAPVPGEVLPAPDRATGVFLEMLRIVEAVGPRVTSTGELHKSDEARAQELCREAGVSDDSLTLALLAGRQLGCVEEKDGRLRTTPVAERWAERSTADRVRDLLGAFLAAQDLPDLRLFFPEVYPALEKHLRANAFRRTYHRSLVARILEAQPAGVWHSVDAFVEVVRHVDRNVLFLEERWRAIESGAREFSAAWQDRAWQAHEKRLFTWMISSLFSGLGMVDMAEDGALFRVTPVGRYALGVASAPADNGNGCKDALVVQPDFEIIAYLDRCPANLRRKLDTFCERRRGGPVSTYLLTQDSMYRGVRTGVDASAFLRLLECCASRAIPSNVRQQFQTWERKLDSVTVRTHCNVIECQDAAGAAKLAGEYANTRIVGDRFVLVDAGSSPNGYARVEYNGARRTCLEQDRGLRLRVPWEKCDLFTRKTLEALGELSIEESGDLILTLSRAKKRRVDWEPVLAQLEIHAGGALPARYRIALRAWNGEVEPALSRTAAVLRFSDSDICQAVLEIDELAEHTEGRLGAYTVVVKQGELAQFKKKLKEYGIAVTPGEEIVDRNGVEATSTEPLPKDSPREAGNSKEKHSSKESDKGNGASDRSAPGENNGEEAVKLPAYSPRIIREIIEDAIARRKPILIEYEPTYGDHATVRRVNPVALDLAGAQPSLSGYCHVHGGPRAFKLSRINGIRVLEDESF